MRMGTPYGSSAVIRPYISEVAVALLDDVPPSRPIVSDEVEVHAVLERADPATASTSRFARGRNVARHEVAERDIGARGSSRGRLRASGRPNATRPSSPGTQMPPSLRNDSDINVSFAWKSSLAGMHVGWICVKQGFASSAASSPPRHARGDVSPSRSWRGRRRCRSRRSRARPRGRTAEHLAAHEVAADDAGRASVLDHEVEHLGAGVSIDR